MATGLAFMSGCGEEKEEFSRYPSVQVPIYCIDGYIRNLSNENPELAYNAICNLGIFAEHFGEMLSADDAEPDSAEYKQAEEAYRSICEQLDSKNPYAVAASLRFLQLFVKKYEAKDELLKSVIQIESDYVLVQFEQATLLKRLVTENSRLPEPLLRNLLKSSSWIVIQTTYELIGRLHDEPLRKELIHRYQNTTDAGESSILLEAISHQLKPEEARMLEADMLSTESPKMRELISMVLADHADVPGVRSWLCDRYEKFSPEDRKRIFSETKDLDLQFAYLAMDYDPGEKFMKARLRDRLAEKKKVGPKDLARIDQALSSAPRTSERWQTMKKEAELDRLRRHALSKDMTPFSQEFLEQAKVVIAQHDFPAEDRDKLIKNLNRALIPYGAKKPVGK